MDWTTIGIPVIGAVLRNVAGWLENSLKDGKIEAYEWGLLGSSILRVGVMGLALGFGLDIDPTSATGLAIGADYLLSALKK